MRVNAFPLTFDWMCVGVAVGRGTKKKRLLLFFFFPFTFIF